MRDPNTTSDRSLLLVLTTAGSEENAVAIARRLVESRLAACVNVVPGVRSIYRWKGELCDEREWLVVVKTVAEDFERVKDAIRAANAYELPEVVAIAADRVDERYARWVSESTATR